MTLVMMVEVASMKAARNLEGYTIMPTTHSSKDCASSCRNNRDVLRGNTPRLILSPHWLKELKERKDLFSIGIRHGKGLNDVVKNSISGVLKKES